MNNQFELEYISWHEKTFNVTKEEQYNKVLIEDKELGQTKTLIERCLEFADVEMALIGYKRLGGDLCDFGDDLNNYYIALNELPIELMTTACWFKFAINKQRKWGCVNGEHRHVS